MAHKIIHTSFKRPCDGGYSRKVTHPKVSVTFDPAQFAAINFIAEQMDISFGEVVRRCIEKAIPQRISEQRKK